MGGRGWREPSLEKRRFACTAAAGGPTTSLEASLCGQVPVSWVPGLIRKGCTGPTLGV